MDYNPDFEEEIEKGKKIMSKKSTLLVLVAIAMCLSLGAVSFAQETTGSIVGTVRDSAGSPIGGATVTATIPSQGNRTIRTVTTSDEGIFSIPNVPINTYSVTIEAP